MQFNKENVIFNVFNAMKDPSDAPKQCEAIFEHFEEKLMEEETKEEEVDEKDVEGNSCNNISMKLELLNLSSRIKPAQKSSLKKAP